MIVPRPALLAAFGATLLPLSVIGALVPGAQLICGAGMALAVAAFIVDALRARGLLRGLRVQTPAVLRFFRDREGALPVTFQPTRRLTGLRAGLVLPPAFTGDEIHAFSLPAGAPAVTMNWQITPHRRGRYEVTGCHVETASPWRLWAVRAAVPVRCELRVYPNLRRDSAQAARFLSQSSAGLRIQRQVGRGREFEKLRDYLPGDDAADIHWKATARRARPVTKVFQLERTQEVYVVIDCSRLTGRGAGDTTEPILERYINAALLLGSIAERQGDLFGLVAYSDRIHSFVRARGGQTHYAACREAIYQVQPQPVAPDLDELFTFLRLRLPRRALVLFLTELDDPALAESFLQRLGVLRKHLVLAGMLRPAGAQPVFTQPAGTVDEVYEAVSGHLRLQALEELRLQLAGRGVHFHLLENESLVAELATAYLNVKRRQLL